MSPPMSRGLVASFSGPLQQPVDAQPVCGFHWPDFNFLSALRSFDWQPFSFLCALRLHVPRLLLCRQNTRIRGEIILQYTHAGLCARAHINTHTRARSRSRAQSVTSHRSSHNYLETRQSDCACKRCCYR